MSPATADLFIDELDGRHARLLLGEQAFTVPRSLLPRDAREGGWVQCSMTVVSGPGGDTEARRQRLGSDDPGGDIKL